MKVPTNSKLGLPSLTHPLGSSGNSIKVKDNSLNIPNLGKVEFKATNRDFSLEETTVDKIIRETLTPVHATDPNVLRFIDNYLYCRDTKQAARLAGMHGRDGAVLIERKDIASCIQKITACAIRKYGYDAEEVVEKVKEVAFIDPAEVQNPDGSFINNLADMAPEVRRAIKKMKVRNEFGEDSNGIKTVIGEIIEIEFWDKLKAIDMLGREKEVFKTTSVVEHSIGKNMRDVLLATGRRAEQAMIEVESRDVSEDEM